MPAMATLINRRLAQALVVALVAIPRLAAAPPEKIVPPGDKEPFLRLEAGGPTAFVTGLALNPDGKVLYAAGYDKVVRVWSMRPNTNRFTPETNAFRVPLGPGLEGGALNALALSSDGIWLAAGGLGLMREGSGFREPGWVVPSVGGISAEMRKDQGLIYVFNTRDGSVRILRGHTGPVVALSFAPIRKNGPPLLVSAAREWDESKSAYAGAVHLWDVDKATLMKGYVLPDIQTKPGLAVQIVGPEANQLRIGIAWDDGFLRVWDVDEDRFAAPGEDGTKNNTLAILPNQTIALTASDDRLQAWDIRKMQPSPMQQIPLASGRSEHCRTRAMALCSSASDGKLDLAALVLHRLQGEREEDWLYLLSLGADNFGAVRARVPLWEGRGDQAALATSPRAADLAVAGNRDHTIRIYRLADLLNGGTKPRQELRSAGTTVRRVEFVNNGKNLGLALQEEAVGAAPQTMLVFDCKERKIGPRGPEWKSALAPSGPWQQTVTSEDKKDAAGQVLHRSFAIVVKKGDSLVGTIPLGEVSSVTAHALLPPKPVSAFALPLVAVAYLDEHQQPWLGLYDGLSGAQIRRLNGHLDAVQSLAFSADGRLLASSADDQTVSVWSLTDIDSVLLRHGSLQGVPFTEKDGTLHVGQVDSQNLDASNREKLREGDVIEGVVTGGRLTRMSSAPDLYKLFWETKPGTNVSLRVKGRANEVSVRIGQGTDERKPLFSLFLTRAEKGVERQWIGWSPLGPYDSSGQAAERHLGWNFNTGDPSAPSRFALADQYRKQYYREGILQQLITEGNLRRVPPPAPLPPPKMALLIEEAGQPLAPDDRGQILVRRPNVNLRCCIIGRSISTLDGATYQVDDHAEQSLALDTAVGQEWSVPLELEPGKHNIRVIVRLPETQAQPCADSLAVRYQPPAPQIEYTGQLRQVVQDPAFVLRARVRPCQVGTGVRVDIRQTHKGKTVAEQSKVYGPEVVAPVSVEQRVQLQPGYNLVELSATNPQPLKGYEALETQRLAVEITLVEKTPPPLLTVDGVLPDGFPERDRLSVEPGQPVVVTVAKVRLLGKITAKENLTEAAWAVEPTSRPAALPGFIGQQKKEWSISQEVQLQPGAQTFRFLARAATSDEAERRVTVFYRPPVPRVEISEPRRGHLVNGEKDSEEIAVRCALQLPDERHAFETEVRINDKALALKADVDEKAGTLTAHVPLQSGENRISVKLSNRWGAMGSAETLVYYRRPPRVLGLSLPNQTRQPSLDTVVRVRSPLPLLRESVRVTVNGNRRTVNALVAEAQGEPGVWTVRIKDLALDAGPLDVNDGQMTNDLRVWVSNREGVCLQPAAGSLLYVPVQPPPQIVFRQQDSVVHSPQCTVRFEVTSASPLKHVQISRDGDPPVTIAVSVRANASGTYSLASQQLVALQPGLNTVQVEAANAGGQQVARLVVSFVHRPVRLVIESLEPDSPSASPLMPQIQPDGALEFPAMSSGKVRLRGRVLWDEENDERLAKTKIVRVYVNEFQQLPAKLDLPAAGSRQRTFQTQLMLNYAQGNHVRIALPDLQQDAANRTDFWVDCQHPERAQRLHLLIVSPQEKNPKSLQERFLQALHCVADPQNQLKTPVFDPVILYGPVLVGDHARPEYVYPQLRRIQMTIRHLAEAGLGGNDVVVFYYQGGESVNAQGHFFTSDLLEPEAAASAMSCDDLVELFASTPGAHILLLDVGRRSPGAPPAPPAGKDRVAHWENDFPADIQLHMAVLRLSWLGSASAYTSARLLPALQQAMPKATKLAEVTEQVASFLKEWNPEQHLSQEMKALVFSRRQDDR